MNTPATDPEARRPAAAPRARSWVPRWLFSMKFAIWIAVALAFVSVGGVLVQEFFPVRGPEDVQRLRQHWPAPAVAAFLAAGLHDPFRALGFRVLLGLLSASLLVCSARRFRSALRQATRVKPIREPRSLLMLGNSATIHAAGEEFFDAAVQRARRARYRGDVERDGETRFAALHRGGIARTGPVLLHVGILSLVVAGLVSSVVGKRSTVLLSAGQTAALDEHRSLRLDRFDIERHPDGMVKQYRSQLAMLVDGREAVRQEVLVNHPLRYAGFSIYQATYRNDPTRAAAMTFALRRRDETTADPHSTHAAPAPGSETLLQVAMEATYPVPGHPGWEFRVAKFFSDLVLGPNGPANRSDDFANPAAILELRHDGRLAGTQWAFARFGAHAKDGVPFVLEMRAAEPAIASGLEVTTQPGTPLVWVGLAMATLGLVFSFLIQHRTLFLVAKPEARGWTLWIAGRSDRERSIFERDFARLALELRSAAKSNRSAASERRSTAEGVLATSAG
jgi:cytochrome c biogenesis protein